MQTTKSTNYLNPKLFYGTFLEWLARLEPFTGDRACRPAAITANEAYWLARIQYGSALRVSEALDLEPSYFDLNHRILTLPHTKTGHGKIQKTTILPYDVAGIEKFLKDRPKDDKIFRVSRATIWKYYKDCSKLADLNIFEAKEIIDIKGAWTHLLRSSCAKMYEDLGAKESLIARKLRHSPGRSMTARYTKVDIGTVLDFEDEKLKEIPNF